MKGIQHLLLSNLARAMTLKLCTKPLSQTLLVYVSQFVFSVHSFELIASNGKTFFCALQVPRIMTLLLIFIKIAHMARATCSTSRPRSQMVMPSHVQLSDSTLESILRRIFIQRRLYFLRSTKCPAYLYIQVKTQHHEILCLSPFHYCSRGRGRDGSIDWKYPHRCRQGQTLKTLRRRRSRQREFVTPDIPSHLPIYLAVCWSSVPK